MEFKKIYDNDYGIKLFVDHIKEKQKRMASLVDFDKLIPFVVTQYRSNQTARLLLQKAITDVIEKQYPGLEFDIFVYKKDVQSFEEIRITYIDGPPSLEVQIRIEKKLKLRSRLSVNRHYSFETLQNEVNRLPEDLKDLVRVEPGNQEIPNAACIVVTKEGEAEPIKCVNLFNEIMRYLGKKSF